jgi:hypothetical protein
VAFPAVLLLVVRFFLAFFPVGDPLAAVAFGSPPDFPSAFSSASASAIARRRAWAAAAREAASGAGPGQEETSPPRRRLELGSAPPSLSTRLNSRGSPRRGHRRQRLGEAATTAVCMLARHAP